MNEQNTAQTKSEEQEEVLKEIRQLENRKKILENIILCSRGILFTKSADDSASTI